MNTNCKNCKYAIVSKEPRVIKRGNITIYQSSKDGVFCGRETVTNITVTNGNIYCGDFESRG